ncbi:ThiF family adenylyltransferase [Flavobacterium limnophilum]|uniref:ThiF family adenylyltransferase n=1 Tax=Flavobacterium limnophilum TaxID=3003262 RepID=UPI0022AC6EB6|nr:ThiF family adenylyltransferase [Flavobacterium limnophilum]
MLQQLINHSPDLKRLQDEGYELEVKGGYLLIHHIPYVTHLREIKYGILVSELSLANSQRTIKPSTHVINFIGEYPCNADGSIITAIQHANQQNLGHGIVINFSFSNKPQSGYLDYYEKVSTYSKIISSPAKNIDTLVTEKTFRIRENAIDTDVFQYIDTNSGRAKINLINEKVKGQKIAIIGLGGTGAYILDLLSKTPVNEIHLYDGDVFSQHNAFRSPGAAGKEDLDTVPSKVDYYYNQYSKIHQKITAHHSYVSKENLEKLLTMSFVFICIDNDVSRKLIIQFLLKNNISFIDVGLGVNVVDDTLIGTVRVTTGTNEKNNHLVDRIPFVDEGNNDYNTNIQIAELNCLNAVLAVIKWKKLSGFYQDLREEHHSTYSINVNQLTSDDVTA